MAVEKMDKGELTVFAKQMANLHRNWSQEDYDKTFKDQCQMCDNTGWKTKLRNGLRIAIGRCNCKQLESENGRIEYLQNVFGKKQEKVEELNEAQGVVNRKFVASRKKSLWLMGENRAGKSAYVYYKLLNFQDKFYAIKGINIDKIFRAQLDSGSYMEKTFDINKYRIIAIDDIEKRWPYSDALKRDVYDLLDKIVDDSNISLLVTSNISIDEYCKAWSDVNQKSLKTRLKEKCLEVKI